MKRLTILLLCLFTAFGLSACSNNYSSPRDHFVIDVLQNCTSDIESISFEYYLNEEAVGGGAICNADGSLLLQGDILSQDFIRKDFPEEPDLLAFSIEYFVKTADGSEYPVGERFDLPAEYGNIYTVTLNGNEADGFYCGLKE